MDIIKGTKVKLGDDPDGNFVATSDIPIPIEIAISTATVRGMDFSLDAILKQLPNVYELTGELLPGYDIQVSLSIYEEEDGEFGLRRTQFGTVDAVTKACSGGTIAKTCRIEKHDIEEMKYALFAAAYLTDNYINTVGLKSYYFYVSGAMSNSHFTLKRLKTLFGKDVLERANANIKKVYGTEKYLTEEVINTMTIHDVMRDLEKLSHTFIVQIGDTPSLHDFWNDAMSGGTSCRIDITSITWLPKMVAAAIGITEGVLPEKNVYGWFLNHGSASQYRLEESIYCLRHIPFGEQARLKATLGRE